MIALDTSSLARFLAGLEGRDTQLVETAIRARAAQLPPVVLVELLSNPTVPPDAATVFESLPLLAIHDGYWERAGRLRERLLGRRRKGAIADCLIAQCCIDNEVPLITHDRDFRHFEGFGLKLL